MHDKVVTKVLRKKKIDIIRKLNLMNSLWHMKLYHPCFND